MTDERNPEVQSLYEWVKNHFLNTVPLTIIGYTLLLVSAAVFRPNLFDFVAGVGTTGIYVFSLGCCYVVGKASHLLINALLSRIITKKEEQA